MKKNKINPQRIIDVIQKNFNKILSKPKLKNLELVCIAIARAKKMSINEIAREIPTNVKRQKSKQTRLLRFLSNPPEMLDMMFVWTELVLKQIYGKNNNPIIILVDGHKLIEGYKSFFAAIPYRKRAIPIAFKVYKDSQISDMTYLSENYIIWNFIDVIFDYLDRIMPKRKVLLVFDRGFSDEKLMRYIDHFDKNYIIRVTKNSFISTSDYEGKLSEFNKSGYFSGVYYNLKEHIMVNLFCDISKDDQFFVVSNLDDNPQLTYRFRMRIEEGFRDLKSLFGFKNIVLKDCNQGRLEFLLFLLIMSMGLLFLLYEKSGYRWLRYYNVSGKKIYSLIRTIKEKIIDSWANLRIDPCFSLDNVRFYEV